MADMSCATCKHWHPPQKRGWRSLDGVSGMCRLIQHGFDGMKAWLDADLDNHPLSDAYLRTKADFGCILFEASAEPPAPLCPRKSRKRKREG